MRLAELDRIKPVVPMVGNPMRKSQPIIVKGETIMQSNTSISD